MGEEADAGEGERATDECWPGDGFFEDEITGDNTKDWNKIEKYGCAGRTDLFETSQVEQECGQYADLGRPVDDPGGAVDEDHGDGDVPEADPIPAQSSVVRPAAATG